jgi:hypothetical protein
VPDRASLVLKMRILLLLLSSLSLAAADKDDVIAVVQKTFDGMAAHDAQVIESCFLKDARLIAIRESGETSSTDLSTFSTRIAATKSKIVERMWNAEVRVEGRIASLWAPYDFHRDGKRTHCGIDQVDLVKTADGWKIAGLIYTVVTTGCPASPLGPIN